MTCTFHIYSKLYTALLLCYTQKTRTKTYSPDTIRVSGKVNKYDLRNCRLKIIKTKTFV